VDERQDANESLSIPGDEIERFMSKGILENTPPAPDVVTAGVRM
jgi:hypothetical protein